MTATPHLDAPNLAAGLPETGSQRRRSRLVVTTAAVIGIGLFVYLNKRDLPAFGAALRAASPAWLLIGSICAVAGVAFGYAGTHKVAIRAAGVDMSFEDGVRLGMRAFALNTLVKSGGLAGIVPYLRHAERRGSSRSQTKTGYLLANVFGDAAIAIVMLVALAVLAAQRRLSGSVVGATVVFGLYLATVGSVIIAAAQSQEAVRRLHGAPLRLIARIRRRPYVVDHEQADSMFEAILRVRSNPRLVVPAVGWAVVVDAAGVVTLLAVLLAFREPASLGVAVSAYAVAMMFSLVSVLPGGLGFAELSLASVLVAAGISAPSAAAIAVTHRIVETWVPAGIGLLVRLPNRTGSGGTTELTEFSRTRLRIRRLVAAVVALQGLILLWLAASRVRFIDVGSVLVNPRAGAIRGSRYLVLVCAVGALLASRGLARGSSGARKLALFAAVGSALVLPIGRSELLGVFVSVTPVTMLLIWRNCFRARSDARSGRFGLQWLGIGGCVVAAYGTIGLYFLDTEVGEGTNLWVAFDNSIRLLFVLPSTTLSPLTRHAAWFVDSVRVLSVAVVGVGSVLIMRPVVDRQRTRQLDLVCVSDLLQRYGRTGLAHFHLLGDKSFVFSPDRLAFVGYRRVGSVAVALGEPIGEANSLRGAASAFVAVCDINGWTPTFHQVTPDGAAVLHDIGMLTLKIGEEALIDLSTFSLEGSHFKRLRSQLRKLSAEGNVIEELKAPISDDVLSELEEVSDQWLGDSGHRERTFSLGRFQKNEIRNSTVLIARSAHRVEAFVNIVPSYVSSDGNFDLMRRRPDSPNGVMDQLFVALTDRFRIDGFTGLSLGLAPLTNITGTSTAARVLRAVSERDSKAFNFRGLRVYKEKWKPRWEPRYLMYPSELSLARIGYAVARVGELRPSAPMLLRLGLPDVTAAPLDEARSGIAEMRSEIL